MSCLCFAPKLQFHHRETALMPQMSFVLKLDLKSFGESVDKKGLGNAQFLNPSFWFVWSLLKSWVKVHALWHENVLPGVSPGSTASSWNFLSCPIFSLSWGILSAIPYYFHGSGSTLSFLSGSLIPSCWKSVLQSPAPCFWHKKKIKWWHFGFGVVI